MKKALVLVLALVVALMFSVSVYSKTDLLLATGGVAGTYYPLGGAMANIINKRVPSLNVSAQSTGASGENLRLINRWEVDLAIVQNDTADYAFRGVEAFSTGALKNFGVIAALYPEIIQIVVRADGPIRTVADLRGKKVSVGAPGSGTEINARQVLAAHGLTYNDISQQFLSFAESASQFQDGHLDAFFVTGRIPNPGIQTVATQHRIRILNLDPARVKALQTEYPFYASATVPANTYMNQPDAASTVAVMAILIANNNLKEADVYNIAKAIFENDGELATAHAAGAAVSLKTALDGISTPLHPGAARYLREKGILK